MRITYIGQERPEHDRHNRRFATSFIEITDTADQRKKKANAPLTNAD